MWRRMQLGYRMSKAALNMAGATIAMHLAKQQVLCFEPLSLANTPNVPQPPRSPYQAL